MCEQSLPSALVLQARTPSPSLSLRVQGRGEEKIQAPSVRTKERGKERRNREQEKRSQRLREGEEGWSGRQHPGKKRVRKKKGTQEGDERKWTWQRAQREGHERQREGGARGIFSNLTLFPQPFSGSLLNKAGTEHQNGSGVRNRRGAIDHRHSSSTERYSC